ncbi:MAG: RNA-directed DNA polymerase [Candidatus Peribacteria bacterium]|nr:RNA-directed DNA polymerase [Candidatus Peribacteria bacterium]
MKLIHQTIFKDYRMYQDVSIPRLNQKFPYRKRMQSTNGTHGLPLGNLTSQLFANIYLHCFDLFVKHELHIKYYGRYVDDFILIHHDKKYLIECSHRIKDFLRTKLKLNLHPNKFYLQYYKKGVKFLGVMIYPHYRVLGKRTISRAFQKLKKKNKADQCIDPRQSRMSYDGLAKHHKCYRLRERRKELYLKKYGDVDNRSK